MTSRKPIKSDSDFEKIRLALADFFDALAAGKVDDDLAVIKTFGKWIPWDYDLDGFGFSYVASILRHPSPSGWKRSKPNPKKREKHICWVHRQDNFDGTEHLYVKIAVMQNPFPDDPNAPFLVYLYSLHGDIDDSGKK